MATKANARPREEVPRAPVPVESLSSHSPKEPRLCPHGQVYAGSISASPGQRSKSLLWVKRCPNWQSGSPNPGLKGPRPRPMPPQQPCQVYKAPPCTLRGRAGECHRPLIRTPHPLSVSLRTSFPLRPTEGSLCSLRETANRPVGESSFKIKSVAAGSLTLSSCPF